MGFVNGATNNLNDWQFLSDQTYGASTLINCKQHAKAMVTLESCLKNIEELAKTYDPSLMVKFWRICLAMRGIDGRGRQFHALQRLFDVMQRAFSQSFGAAHSLSCLIQSLRQVSPEDFKATLRIGFDKTIRMLASLVGDENAVVLHMWSHYFKYWDKQYLAQDTFILKFDLLWHRIHSSHDYLSEEAIAISYYYSYAVYYLGDVPVLGEYMMRDLFHLTTIYLRLQPVVRWTLPTLAFAFSAKAVATIDQKKGRKDLCISLMDFAIDVLEHGDRECRTRAVLLGAILKKWLSRWGMLREAQRRSEQVALMLDTIV